MDPVTIEGLQQIISEYGKEISRLRRALYEFIEVADGVTSNMTCSDWDEFSDAIEKASNILMKGSV